MAKIPVAAFLLLAQQVFQNTFLQEIELRLIAEETCFVDGKIFEQQRKLGASFAAREQSVVAVKRIELTNFEPALKAVLQKVRAALVEKHAALLVDERLQKLQLGFGKLHLSG